jgi:predicted methyltransferase
MHTFPKRSAAARRLFRHVMPAFVSLGVLPFIACSPPPPAAPPEPPPPVPAPELIAEPPEREPESELEAAPAAGQPGVTGAVRAAVDATDRSEDDRVLDPQRQPDRLLSFFGIAPGMRVAELGAGGGYTTELLARVVGPAGRVYGQNNKFVLERFAAGPWGERLKKPALANVTRVDTEFDAPLPDDARNLDAVLVVLFYHDTVWFGADRKKMNTAVHRALKPGGVYGIVDHSARPGEGLSQTKTLHRIEEAALTKEVQEAGFVLEASADFLRNPEDSRDWNASPSAAAERRGMSDRFVLRFKKPGGA